MSLRPRMASLTAMVIVCPKWFDSALSITSAEYVMLLVRSILSIRILEDLFEVGIMYYILKSSFNVAGRIRKVDIKIAMYYIKL